MRCYEEGQGSSVVLIHGMFGDHLDWEPVIEPLAAAHRVIAVDLPGFGEADKPAADYTAELFTGSLRAALGEEPVTLVGNSFGGQVAMLYALAYPEQVRSLVLVASGGFARYSPEEQALAAARLSEPVLRSMTTQFVRILFTPLFVSRNGVTERYVARQQERLARPDYPAYARAMASSLRLSLHTCLLDELPRIACPTLLLWGDRDYVVPVDLARQAVGLFPAAQLTVFPGCGHLPQLERPEAFVRTVAPFLPPPV